MADFHRNLSETIKIRVTPEQAAVIRDGFPRRTLPKVLTPWLMAEAMARIAARDAEPDPDEPDEAEPTRAA